MGWLGWVVLVGGAAALAALLATRPIRAYMGARDGRR